MRDGNSRQGGTGRDWVAWHVAYDDSRSSLARRLTIVRRRVGDVLDAHLGGSGSIRILSLCAGDGRDLLPELASRPHVTTQATLVELDAHLVATARAAASGIDGVDVRRGDAGDTHVFADVLPVDLLLLCGILGNISVADIRTTVAAVPSMLADAGTVVWTRGWFADEDLRPAVRRWFRSAGLREIAFDGDPERFGVGVHQLERALAGAPPIEERLFSFVR